MNTMEWKQIHFGLLLQMAFQVTILMLLNNWKNIGSKKADNSTFLTRNDPFSMPQSTALVSFIGKTTQNQHAHLRTYLIYM